MVVDYDGRILTQASPGPGERIVVAPINIEMLRHERKTRRAHQMLAHLRTEAYPFYSKALFPGETLDRPEDLTVTELEKRIDAAKQKVGYLGEGQTSPSPNIQALLDVSKDRVE